MIDERKLIKTLEEWKSEASDVVGLKSEALYDFDSEWGYYVSGCDYWCEIEWEDKE